MDKHVRIMQPNAKQWLCIAVSISGVMMVSLGTSSGENTLLGCLCLLGAYLCGSIYSILVRKLSKDFTAFELTYVMFTEGFLFFAVLLMIQNGAGAGAAVADGADAAVAFHTFAGKLFDSVHG